MARKEGLEKWNDELNVQEGLLEKEPAKKIDCIDMDDTSCQFTHALEAARHAKPIIEYPQSQLVKLSMAALISSSTMMCIFSLCNQAVSSKKQGSPG